MQTAEPPNRRYAAVVADYYWIKELVITPVRFADRDLIANAIASTMARAPTVIPMIAPVLRLEFCVDDTVGCSQGPVKLAHLQ